MLPSGIGGGCGYGGGVAAVDGGKAKRAKDGLTLAKALGSHYII